MLDFYRFMYRSQTESSEQHVVGQSPYHMTWTSLLPAESAYT